MIRSIAKSQCWKNLYHLPDNVKSTLPHVVEDFCRIQRPSQEQLSKKCEDLSFFGVNKTGLIYNNGLEQFANCNRLHITTTDEPVHTRTEQLSFPKVGKLTELLEHSIYPKFSVERKKSINDMLKKSMQSIYSYLSKTNDNVCAEEMETPKQLRKREYKNHLERLAKPKNVGKKIERDKRACNSDKRSANSKQRKLAQDRNEVNAVLDKLAQPRLRTDDLKAKAWELTESLRTYEPSTRILEMAKPKLTLSNEKENPFGVKKSALFYEPNGRILQLAYPLGIGMKIERGHYSYDDFFRVPQTALFANASDRIKELARPKRALDKNSRRNPFNVRAKALRAKASHRVRYLSQPKHF